MEYRLKSEPGSNEERNSIRTRI